MMQARRQARQYLATALRERLNATNLPATSVSRKLVNTFVLRPVRRMLLKQRLLHSASKLARGITVIIPVKNRGGYRLRNLLRSLRGQTAKQDMYVLIVDYASHPEIAFQLATLADAYETELICVKGPQEWNRSRALNLGIRHARTEYILCTDADLVFQRNYVEMALRRLRANPLLLVVSSMLDLPEGHPTEISLDSFVTLRARARPRYDLPYHPSIIATGKDAVELIGGYDESYRLWGTEDVDLFLRLRSFGLDVQNISDDSVYLHQWHAKFEGVRCASLPEQIRWNDDYLRRKRTIRHRLPSP